MDPDVADFESEFQPEFVPRIPEVLPMGKMYSVQIGSKCFKLSGASLSSDSPSYFTSYFSKSENADRTLFIDRSPVVFDKIVLHLQGYFVDVTTPTEFVYIFLDAFYFNLPRLKAQLYQSDIFAKIGSQDFKFSKKAISSRGNTPNFFSVAYNAIFRDPAALMSGMDLLRPPPQAPIVLVDRCPKLFETILYYLQGYEIDIPSDSMRAKLIRECRYYRFLELEQRIVKHKIALNPFTIQEEITISLGDLRPRGLSLYADLDCSPKLSADAAAPSFSSNNNSNSNSPDVNLATSLLDDYTSLRYARPWADTLARVLVVQVSCNETFLIFDKPSHKVYVRFLNQTASKFCQLFRQFVRNPAMASSFQCVENEAPEITASVTVEAVVDRSTFLKLNETNMRENWLQGVFGQQPDGHELPLTLSNSQWKVQVKQDSFKLYASKLEGVTNEFAWNKQRDFL